MRVICRDLKYYAFQNIVVRLRDQCPIILHDTRKCDIFLYLVNLNRWFIAWERVRDDNDVATFDFRDPVSLVANRLNGNLPNLSLINRGC